MLFLSDGYLFNRYEVKKVRVGLNCKSRTRLKKI